MAWTSPSKPPSRAPALALSMVNGTQGAFLSNQGEKKEHTARLSARSRTAACRARVARLSPHIGWWVPCCSQVSQQRGNFHLFGQICHIGVILERSPACSGTSPRMGVAESGRGKDKERGRAVSPRSPQTSSPRRSPAKGGGSRGTAKAEMDTRTDSRGLVLLCSLLFPQ